MNNIQYPVFSFLLIEGIALGFVAFSSGANIPGMGSFMSYVWAFVIALVLYILYVLDQLKV